MNKKTLIPFTLIAMLLLAACTPVSPVSQTPQTSAENTQPAVTATVILPNTGATLAPTATATAAPTLTPTSTSTQAPTQTPIIPTLTATPVPVVSVPCDSASFVGDFSIPDGTAIDPGASFTKTWQLENTGACTWTTGYAIVFVSGSLMSGPTIVNLPYTVYPGGTVDVSVNLVAPISAGTYQGNWMLRDANGNVFGIGPDANQPFWVNIAVNSSTIFAVTSVVTSIDNSSYTDICPVTIKFQAQIYTNGAGTVTYYWVRSDGTKSSEKTLTYDSAGYQTVKDSWTLGTPNTVVNGWDRIYIHQPNNQYFSRVDFTVACYAATPTQTATTAPTLTPTPVPTLTATTAPTLAPTVVSTTTSTPTPTTRPTSTTTRHHRS